MTLSSLRVLWSAALLGYFFSVTAQMHVLAEEPKSAITHRFLACGNETYICEADGKMSWHYPQSTRDGWVLPGGNLLLTISKNKDFPGGGVVEVTKEGKVVFEYKGKQSEVNTSQWLDKDRILVTEAGDKPRLLEIGRDGKILFELAIEAQIKDHHLQSRMARKLKNGNYLVPQLLDKVVCEYSPKGEIVWKVNTPNMPFTAIRLENGNTLIGCTLGDLVIEVNKEGKTIWQVSNEDLPGKPINDACGVQRLPNGNTVITSHHAKGDEVRLTEVTPEKKIVWQFRNAKTPGIHHFQILDTNGKPIEGKPLK